MVSELGSQGLPFLWFHPKRISARFLKFASCCPLCQHVFWERDSFLPGRLPQERRSLLHLQSWSAEPHGVACLTQGLHLWVWRRVGWIWMVRVMGTDSVLCIGWWTQWQEASVDRHRETRGVWAFGGMNELTAWLLARLEQGQMRWGRCN